MENSLIPTTIHSTKRCAMRSTGCDR